MMLPAQFLFLLFLAFPLLAASGARPNILLIITDDQGYGDFSLHGNPHLQTPHIDKLGTAGVRFDRFYVNSFCAPTRAALLTGRWPLRTGCHGVTHNREAMRPSEVTLAEALKTAGYRTACIGKWHNGEQFPFTPQGQGFDESFGFNNGHWNNYFDRHAPARLQARADQRLHHRRAHRRGDRVHQPPTRLRRSSATSPTTRRTRRIRCRTDISTSSRPGIRRQRGRVLRHVREHRRQRGPAARASRCPAARREHHRALPHRQRRHRGREDSTTPECAAARPACTRAAPASRCSSAGPRQNGSRTS